MESEALPLFQVLKQIISQQDRITNAGENNLQHWGVHNCLGTTETMGLNAYSMVSCSHTVTSMYISCSQLHWLSLDN